MQVELVHRNDLTVTSSSCSSLDTESRSLRRLPDTGEGTLAEVSSKSLSETDGGG